MNIVDVCNAGLFQWLLYACCFARIQTGFEYQFNQYGKLKKEDINALDHETLQTWKRTQRYIIF